MNWFCERVIDVDAIHAAPVVRSVQYVKICSLYGVGFYYMPGTDMCLKIGGWVRAEYAYGDNGNFAWGWANGNVNNRTTNNSTPGVHAATSPPMPAARANMAPCAAISQLA